MSEQETEVQATPAAEAKAEELGVDLTQVEPSGASGNVVVADVKAAAEEGSDAPEATTQGDLTPDADEHPVDTTPPQSPDGANVGAEPGDAHEPMVHEAGDANERGVGGGDGTVWNG